MRTSILRGAFSVGALLALFGTEACAVQRPSRNGVFNENQYVRKDFLIEKVDADGKPVSEDPGWMVTYAVTETSTPNLLGSAMSVWGGLTEGTDLVRFRVTQDHLQALSTRKFATPTNPDGNPDPTSTTDVVLNSWAATNVDLKYRVNLDGERTNFYEENQELNWQDRQWVKLNFAKNDFSDLAPLGEYTNDLLSKCADVSNSSATLVDGSFVTEGQETADPSDDYMSWTVQVTMPMRVDDTTCIQAYGPMADNAFKFGQTNVTVNLKYSMKRATPQSQLTYHPWALDEKDPIHRKYGPFLVTVFNRDTNTGLVAANQYVGRFDPTKPIVWYFDKNFPQKYKAFFTDPQTGIGAATNAILAKSGAAARVEFHDWNDGGVERQFGDIRYNFLRWASDMDLQDGFAGVTMPAFDPRTGEIVNENIEFNDFAIKDYYVQRIDAFLTGMGLGGINGPDAVVTTTTDETGKSVTYQPNDPQNPSGWKVGSCTPGSLARIVPRTLLTKHNATSTVFTKMQQYLNTNNTATTDTTLNHLGPQDWIVKQDDDFLKAYYSLVPYQTFADPDMNMFVTREGGEGVYGPASVWQHLKDDYEFFQTARSIDQGLAPYQYQDDANGFSSALKFANRFRQVSSSHMEYQRMRTFLHPSVKMDSVDAFSVESVMAKDSQRCVNGQWETRDSWVQGLIDNYWQQVFWHEFGHSLGLEHNFMASIDKPNFPPPAFVDDKSGQVYPDAKSVPAGHTATPQYSIASSSIMEYTTNPDRLFWTPGWGSYDQGALAFIYANDGSTAGKSCKVDTDCAASSKCSSGVCVGTSISGQVDPSTPYKDPLGFDANGKELTFLRCDENHLKYSPLCRQGDLGTTPSEIVANAIDLYEWQYTWRNTRGYRKVWDNSQYAGIVGAFSDTKRFLSLWAYDWSGAEIIDAIHRLGIVAPPTAPSAQDYYAQLENKFSTEIAGANSMLAAFHEAIIQQGSGERPYATVYDKFYGDEVQQGIILDKYFAMQNWVGMWPADNYDQNQAGAYISSWADFAFPSQYDSVAETTIASMLGGGYAVYPYFVPTAVALFAQDTHDPAFTGKIQARDWVGGQAFYRLDDFLTYFRQIAVQNGKCSSLANCSYDPTDVSETTQVAYTDLNHRVFRAPDGLYYIWMYLPSRNAYITARQDRNTVTFNVIKQYNDALIVQGDDGSNGLYNIELQIKYTLDAFKQFD